MRQARPQELVWTLFGEFLLHRAEPVWVGSLLKLLSPLGVTEGHARTVLSRMTSKGWLRARRRGRRSYYELSGRGRRLLEEGEARIYHGTRAAGWDGEWTLLAYSIPEELRSRRDRLRVRLSWLGFGSLGNGMWLSPHDVVERVREAGEELGVLAHLQVFRGHHGGFSELTSLVAQCWDLPALNVRYESFVARHLPEYYAVRTTAVTPVEAYVRRFELVHEYRAFPLLDPYLPRPLQPSDWAGECAQALFVAYRTLLLSGADGWVESVVETLPLTRGSAMH